MLDWKTLGQTLETRLTDVKSGTDITRVDVHSVGVTITSGDGVAVVDGLLDCVLGELIEFDGGGSGIVMNLNRNNVGVVLLGNEASVPESAQARGTGRVLMVPCGESLLGRVVSPLGEPLAGRGPIHWDEMRPIETGAPTILSRKPVDTPMETGLLAIDAIVPIGRGQRELIIGDRQIGKTAIALDAILNQKGKNVYCFYVAIGQKASSIARLVERLRMADALDYTTIICSTASDAASIQYIAPYAGCAMAEHFMYGGKDALIVYDDLTKHAVAYRSMSLLLHRPPGREAYPGDVFYLHSRLLERAARLNEENGGGSMTALPIIETQAGDISARTSARRFRAACPSAAWAALPRPRPCARWRAGCAWNWRSTGNCRCSRSSPRTWTSPPGIRCATARSLPSSSPRRTASPSPWHGRLSFCTARPTPSSPTTHLSRRCASSRRNFPTICRAAIPRGSRGSPKRGFSIRRLRKA